MVRLTYYTDPACPWSWASEPALRRLQMEFGTELQITYVMAGMARELDDPLQVLHDTLEAAAWSGMPVDPGIWRQWPPRSTYPASQVVKAASGRARRPSCDSWPLSGARPERVGLGELLSPTA
jgi:predicted DsbA family dithiol-disulfide isomerase